MTKLFKIEAAPRSHREGSDSYHSVIVRSAKYRVIVCKENHQWIIQRRAGLRHGAPRWESLSYCRDRNALIRLWTGLHRYQPPRAWPELYALPEKFGGKT
jgi:hypothetical protein